MQNVLKDTFQIRLACSTEYQKYLSGDFLTVHSNPSADQMNFLKRIRALANQFKTMRIILRHESDIIVLQAGFLPVILLTIGTIRKKYLINKKIYLTIYSDQISGPGFKSWIKRVLFKLCKKRLAGIITGIDQLGQLYGVPALIIPDYFGREVKEVPGQTKEFAYDVAMVGIISDEKDVEAVVDIFAGTELKVIIAGRFNSQERYRNLLKRLGKSSNISILNGYLDEDEYLSIIRNSRYIILPYKSKRLQSSGVYYDSLLQLRPLLVSDAPFFADVEKNGIGYRYSTLPAQMYTFLTDQKKYVALQRNIYSYITKIQEESKQKILDFFCESQI